MARILLYISLALALLSLATSLIARRRDAQSPTAVRPYALLIPFAIVIGVLPGILDVTSPATRLGASVVSIVLSVTSLVVIARTFGPRA